MTTHAPVRTTIDEAQEHGPHHPIASDASPVARKRRRRNERNAAAYDDDVCELLQAIDAWRRKSGRSFPAWSEALQILKALGWRKVGTNAKVAAEATAVAPLPVDEGDPVEPIE